MEYTTMPASRTTESLPQSSSNESLNDAAKNNGNLLPQSMEYARLKLSIGAAEAIASYHSETEDVLLNRGDKGVYGVFDGAGGAGGNPAAAAQAAARATGELLSTSDRVVTSYDMIDEQLAAAVDYARKEVAERGRGGATVGTVAKLYNYEGRAVLGVAHAGDTRLFRYSSSEKTYTDLTPDQSVRNVINNGLFYGEHSEKDYYAVIDDIQPGDRLMFCSDGITGDKPEQHLSEAEFIDAFSQPNADAAAQRFLELSKKDDDKTVLVIDISEAQPVTSPKPRTPKDIEAFVKMRTAKKANNTKQPDDADKMPAIPAAPAHAPSKPVSTVTPLDIAQRAKRSPKHLADTMPDLPRQSFSSTEADNDRQEESDAQRGFRVINKRVRSRDELLYTPLDELMASIDESKLTRRAHGKHVASLDQGEDDNEAVPGEQAMSSQQSAPEAEQDTEELPIVAASSATDVNGSRPPLPDRDPIVQNYIIPPKPDYAPTIHRRGNPLAYLASRLSAANFIRKNKREAAGKSREYFGFDADKQEKTAKIALGVVAVSLVGIAAWKLGWEMRDGIDTSVVPVGGPGNGSLDSRAAEAAEIAAQHAQVLESPTNIIPTGGGGVEFASANGVDQSLWYQNQAEFMQKFPSETYVMGDGNVGFAHPGELSDAAKVFWAQKFGKWR
jgi:protein phosphatase